MNKAVVNKAAKAILEGKDVRQAIFEASSVPEGNTPLFKEACNSQYFRDINDYLDLPPEIWFEEGEDSDDTLMAVAAISDDDELFYSLKDNTFKIVASSYDGQIGGDKIWPESKKEQFKSYLTYVRYYLDYAFEAEDYEDFKDFLEQEASEEELKDFKNYGF